MPFSKHQYGQEQVLMEYQTGKFYFEQGEKDAKSKNGWQHNPAISASAPCNVLDSDNVCFVLVGYPYKMVV